MTCRWALPALLACAGGAASPLTADAQGVVVAGVVHSSGGRPVQGAHIRAVVRRLETVSGPAGEFRLRLPTVNGVALTDTLRVERIGFGSRTVVVSLRDSVARVAIELNEVALRLDDMVVTATAGTQTRRAQAGIVATIAVADLNEVIPLATLPDALQGRVTSLDVTPSSGSSGEAQRTWLRGATSLALSNEPLVFIDGIRADSRIQRMRPDVGGQAASRLFDIAPADIERIEIVKGPAAAAIYGAEASSGVIQIFTRRGTIGREHITQRIQIEGGAIDANWSPPANFARCGAVDTAPGSQSSLCRGAQVGSIVSDNPLRRSGALRTGRAREVRWSAEGGGPNFGVYASAGASTESGTLPQNGFDRQTLRFSTRWLPAPSLVVEGAYGYMATRTAHPQNGDNPDFGLLVAGTLGNPLTVGTRRDGAFNAPVHALTSVEQRLRVSRATPTLQIIHAPGTRLHQRLILGLDASHSVGRFFVPLQSDGAFVGGAADGVVREDQETYQLFSVDYLGTATLLDLPRQGLSARMSSGAQYVENTDEGILVSGSGLVSNYANRVSHAAVRTGTTFNQRTRSLGTFAQVELGVRDRLFLQAGARADRHSSFGRRAPPQWFPKVGASWVVADAEHGWLVLPGLTTLRLRAAYGTSGRAPPPAQAGATYAAAPLLRDPNTIMQGLTPLGPGNPTLRPERGSELEVGADAAFLRDQLALELTWFDKRSTDLLYRVAQPPSLGFPVDPLGNVDATIRNRGLEATARWNGRIAAHPTNAHLGLSTLTNVAPFQRTRPLGAMYGYRLERVDAAAEHAVVSDTVEYVGPSMPAYTAFVGATVEVASGLRVHLGVDGKGGYWQHNMDADARDRYIRNSERAVRSADLSPEERLTRFGPFVTQSGRSVSTTEVLGPYLQDASFVRWRELSLTWDTPRAWARRLLGTTASLTIAGRNLRLWTRYEGDPEVVSLISENPKGGDVQYAQPTLLTMPQARRWSARLSLSF